MRAALSILGLVIVFAIVMFTMKHQAQQVAASRAASSASSAPSAASPASAPLPDPRAVGRQVEDLLKQDAQRASDAQP